MITTDLRGVNLTDLTSAESRKQSDLATKDVRGSLKCVTFSPGLFVHIQASIQLSEVHSTTASSGAVVLTYVLMLVKCIYIHK